LRPPEDKDAAAKWDPIEEVIKLFKKEFGLSSPEKVRKLQGLTRKPGETCRMLRSPLEKLCEETGLLTEREKAVKFVKALEPELRAQVRPVLYASSEGGHYTLDQAFSIAEKIDLASAYADKVEEVSHGVTLGSEDRRVVEDARGFGKRRGAFSAAADAKGGPCYRCGDAHHQARDCHLSRQMVCGVCHKTGHAKEACWERNPSLKPDWAERKSGGRSGMGHDQEVEALRAQVARLDQQLAALTGKPVRSASARQATLEGHDGDEYDEAPDEGRPPVSNGLGAQLLASPTGKHPMDADFEDPEYQARCAKIDAYFAEKEREWQNRNGH
jgi:hypothetical protein